MKIQNFLLTSIALTISVLLIVPLIQSKLPKTEPKTVQAQELTLEQQKIKLEKIEEKTKLEKEQVDLKTQSETLLKKSQELQPRIEELETQINTNNFEPKTEEKASPQIGGIEVQAKEAPKVEAQSSSSETPETLIEKYKKVSQVDQSIIDKVLSQKDIYLKAKEFGCHPALLAGIHYRETNLGLTNSWNGQGFYQNTGNNYPSNSEVTDHDFQTKQACEHLKNKVGAKELMDLNDIELVGKALARYNGCNNKTFNNCGYVIGKLEQETPIFTKCSVDYICHPLVNDNRFGAYTIAVATYNLF